MKHITLIVFLVTFCFVGFAQTKKPPVLKRTNDSAGNSVLKQEKIWPVFNKNVKNTNSVIKAPAVVNTWNKL